MSTGKYDDDMYRERHKRTLPTAESVIDIVLGTLPSVSSAVDIGCGTGTWLSVLKNRGIDDVLGIDGPWVDAKYLNIPEESFLRKDLTRPFDLDRRFGLAISLEVAEHLPGRVAASFVESLTQLSDFVLFSAAIPGQGGNGHVNEQWVSYWIALFRNHDYSAVDIVRKRIWNDETIPFWYRQNTLLFCKKARLHELHVANVLADYTAPEEYILYFNRLLSPGVKQSCKNLGAAIVTRLRSELSRIVP